MKLAGWSVFLFTSTKEVFEFYLPLSYVLLLTHYPGFVVVDVVHACEVAEHDESVQYVVHDVTSVSNEPYAVIIRVIPCPRG